MRLALGGLSVILFSSLFGQLQTEVITPDQNTGKDAFILSAVPNNNYGNNNRMRSISALNGVARFRSLIEFDLSSIPDNAIISDANLRLHEANFHGQAQLRLSMISESWDESTVQWSNRPSVIGTGSINVPAVPSTTYHNFDVSSHIVNWVNGGYENHGWQIKVRQDQNGQQRGYSFSTSDRPNVNFRPRLTVNYYLPIDFDGSVTHCSEGADDGEITISNITGGSGSTNISVEWYDATENIISTNNTISGLAPGYYIAYLKDGTEAKCNRAKIFLIGRKCEINEVAIKLSDAFMEDINVFEGQPFNNFPTLAQSLTGRINNNQISSHFRYHFGGLDDVNPNSVTLTFQKTNAYTNIGQEDEVNLERKNFYWNEELANWNSVLQTITPSLSTHQVTEISTNVWSVDLTNPFRDYKDNPTNEFQFQLTAVDNPPLSTANNWLTWFFSSSAANPVNIPGLKITFTLSDPCYFNALERRVSSRLVELDTDILKISYKENYAIQSGNKLEYKIYDVSRNVVAGVENGVALIANSPIVDHFEGYTEESLDFSSLNLPSGYYYLEVYLEKNETRYLKIKIN